MPDSTHPLFKKAAAASFALILTGVAWSAPATQFQPAYDQFILATQGNEGAIGKAADSFVELLRKEPTNPVLMAYAGAATAMKATTTLLPWKKMGYADDGLAMLDKSLSLLNTTHNAALQHDVPAVLEVKFVAANTFLAVPGFMNRGARGAKLLADVTASALLTTAPLSFRGDVWMKAASVATKDKRFDEARKFLNGVINANAPQAQAARAQLGTLAS